jgi:hypothetical protein
MVRTVTWLGAAALLAGCYNYEPRRTAQLVPSTFLAVTLSEAGSEQLAQYVGPNVLVVRGRFVRTTERGLALSVEAVEDRRGQAFEWQGEMVVVPGEFVRSLEERHAARGKTVMLAGVSVVGFVAAYAAFGPGASGSTPGGGGPTSMPR